jgi:hypothetical protein
MMKVKVAFAIAEVAVAQYDEYWKYCMKTEWNWSEVERLARIANDAVRQLGQARHEALNPDECTCKPEGDACPVCVGDNKDRYGDTIPFGGA